LCRFCVWFARAEHVRSLLDHSQRNRLGSREMEQPTKLKSCSRWQRYLPPFNWLAHYQPRWLTNDFIAGVTLAAYAIPVALAYATLAGLPPQVGIYGYLLGGLGYALFGSSRHLAIGPTSAISLMVAGTVGEMAGGDAAHYVAIASLAGFTVALLCLISWLLRLSILVRLISDSILVGFKAGAGLTIIMTQLPSLLGVSGGGHNFFERMVLLFGEFGQIQLLVFAVGTIAIVLLYSGERAFPGRPVALAVVVLAIVAASIFGLPARGIAVTGEIPSGLPSLAFPTLRLRDVDGIFPLAAGCLLLAYIEGISAARSFALKHGYELDPRQEFLGLGAANLAAALGHGYPVAGGLSQSAVNEKAGARTPLALVFASLTLALSLLFLTGFLQNLPKAVLAAVVFTAVLGLVDVRTLTRMWRISKPDFYAAAIALAAVLLLGILQGILLAAAASVLILLARASQPHVAFLGRIPGTNSYSDLARHPENEQLPHMIAFRPEASLLYVNADFVLSVIQERLKKSEQAKIRMVVCDLSASPYVDLAGSRMLRLLHTELASSGIALRIVGARGRVRDLLRADGLGGIVSDRLTKLENVVDTSA
jgi:sulfate permease, SulP family